MYKLQNLIYKLQNILGRATHVLVGATHNVNTVTEGYCQGKQHKISVMTGCIQIGLNLECCVILSSSCVK